MAMNILYSDRLYASLTTSCFSGNSRCPSTNTAFTAGMQELEQCKEQLPKDREETY